MTIKRGKRRSLIVETARTRVRVVPGRFRLGARRDQPGVFVVAAKLVLLTVYRRSSA